MIWVEIRPLLVTEPVVGIVRRSRIRPMPEIKANETQ